MKRSTTNLTLIIFAAAMLVAVTNLFAQKTQMQNFRPYDKAGLTVFEPEKQATDTTFEDVKVRWGAHFTQQFQSLDHTNSAAANIVEGVDQNKLIEIGSGFNLATANLNLDAQLAEGIRVNLTTYLSSRHHSEAWVKGGYLQIDALPMLNSKFVDKLMENLTIRAGHFEINYGDAHFRRTDNGNAMYNPLVGNYIMDAFTTEIGGEVYYTNSGFIAMAGITGGEIKGGVADPDKKAPTYLGKLGYDKQVSNDLRLRLTGSVYTTARSASNTLYSGDRTGARYYDVMVNKAGADFTSGRFNPGFRDDVTAFMVNPFIKFNRLELFGTYETATGSSAAEASNRTWDQYAVDAVYRLLSRENVYVAARYNKVSGELQGSGLDANIERVQAGLGWFLTNNILIKGEYVKQNYNNFPTSDIRNGGEFKGFIFEAVIGF